jgi:phosphoenolpyruvate carboxykinase (ATP)
MLGAALDGSLLEAEYVKDPIFGFAVPRTCNGVPPEVLDPSSSWASKDQYMDKYRDLATRFIDNFKKYAPDCPREVLEEGPVL